MTLRKLAVSMLIVSLATIAVWSSLGEVIPARAQPTIEIRSNVQGTDRPPKPLEPVFLLLLGSDTREGSPDGGHIDAIHIVGIDPVTGFAGLMGVPEDAWVRGPAARFETLARIGSQHGSDQVRKTMQTVSGCTFDHTITTGFAGFRALVDDIGGIEFTVPRRLKERGGSHIDLQKGRQTLTGEQALSWARLRKGQTRPRGDLSRAAAQNTLLLAALSEARRDFDKSPGALLQMLAAFRRNVSHDMTVAQGVRLGQALIAISPKKVRSTVVHTTAATIEGRPVRQISKRGESEFVDLCGDGALEANR